MTGIEAVNYIHSVSWMGSRPGLERIKTLSDMMGNPEKELRCIHVAGTNGKGSFCAMTDSILRAAGYKVGLFTSPYVVSFNERIRVDGENISDDDLGDVTEYVKSFADKMEESPTEFELLTAIGFEYFKRQKCEVVVLETGLGGRLDSTNIIKSPVMSVITGIALDHTAFLGDTVSEIAAEKSGIIKEGRPVVFGGEDEEALEVIENTAEVRHAELTTVDYSRITFAESTLDGTTFTFGDGEKYSLNLLGDYQIRNAALVLTAVDVLRKEGFVIGEDAVRQGLESVKWPARLEIIGRDPTVIYDGAHNPQGVSATTDILKRLFGEGGCVILTGMMADKDHSFMVSKLVETGRVIHTVTPDNPRAMSAEELACEVRSTGGKATAHSSVEEGVAAAVNDARELGLPIAALGSLYMYAEVLDAVRKYTRK